MVNPVTLQFLALAVFLLAPAITGEAVVQNSDRSNLLDEITTEELIRLMKDDTCVLVDTRDSNAFNGWRLDGVARGGHIPGAINFSAAWLDIKVADRDETFQATLKEKGITGEKRIVLYDSDDRDREKIAFFLQSQGITGISSYDLRLWINDQKLQLEKYPNFQFLVPPQIANQLINGQRPETFEKATTVKFAEVSWGDESKSYDLGHIPGSFHINTDSVEPPPKWMLASDEELARFALAHGFVHTDTVILCGEDQMAAFRVAVILRYIGVQDVRVLNGGLAAWKAAGMKLETDRREPVPSIEFGAAIPARPELIDTYREVLEGLKNRERFTLVDNRTWEEHIGEISGYSYHFKKGRVPGARFGHSGKTGASSLGYYRNVDGTLRSADELQSLWQQSGINTNTHL